jgi:hypothetical protein
MVFKETKKKIIYIKIVICFEFTYFQPTKKEHINIE